MKTLMALGLAASSLLLVVAVFHTGNGPQHLPEDKPSSAKSQQLYRIAQARRARARAESQAPRVTPQAQAVDAILLAAIKAENDPDHRSETLERFVQTVSDADLAVTLDLLADDVSSGATELRQFLVRRWAESDAPGAAAWTSQLPESPVRSAALEQVAIAWANTDLPAAAGWVQALSEGDSKQTATIALAYEAARTEPIVALELASTLPATPERDELLVHAVSQWSDFSSATDWAMHVIDPSLRQRLIAAVAVAWAEQDGAAAAMLAARALRVGDEQDRAVVSIVQRWAQNSPQAAADWVSKFPNIPSREAAVQNLLALWTAQDSEAAGDWLRGLPAGLLHDVGIAAYDQALRDLPQIPAAKAPSGRM